VTDDEGDGTTASESAEQPRVFTVENRETPSPTRTADSTEEFTWTWSSSDDRDAEADAGIGTDSRNGIARPDADPREDAVANDASAVLTSDESTADAASAGEDGSETSTEAFWPSDDAVSDTATHRAGTDERGEGNTELTQEQEDGPYQARVPDSGSTTENGEEGTVSSPQPAAVSDGENPFDRARRLIDELRTLIPPPLPSGEDKQSPAPAIPEGLRDDLEAARSSADFGELRSTLESAQARPRDVDTMLELVGRIGTMLEALNDRDRLAAAVNQAIDRLDAPASLGGDSR